jgi:hypothetical protein
MKKEIRKINRLQWDCYIVDSEYDMHECRDKAYKIMKEQNKTEKDTICLTLIPLLQ